MQHTIILKNTTYQIIARIVTSSITFLTTIVIASHFGLHAFGEFTQITAFVGLFYVVIDFGFNAVFLQYKDDAHFQSLFFTRLLGALFLIGIVAFLVQLLPFQQELGLGFSPLAKTGILLFSLSLVIQAVIISASAIFQKTHQYYKLTVASTIGSLVALLLIVFFVQSGGTVLHMIIALLVGNMFTAILAMVFTGESFTRPFYNAQFSKKLFLESLPLGLMLVFNLIYFRIDIFLLSVLKPATDVGIYGLSYRFFDFLIALPLFLSNSLYPFLLNAQKNNRSYLPILKKYIFIYFIISLLLIFPLWFLSPLFSVIKPEFLQAIIPFRILLLSLPLFFLTSVLQWGLIAEKKQLLLAKIYLCSAIGNIMLNIMFIPIGSYIASAIITVFSELLVCISLFYFFYRLEKNIQNQHQI